MREMLAPYSASISELKRNPTALINQSEGEPIVILSHNKPMAYLLPAKVFEMILNQIEDKALADIIEARRHEFKKAVEVDINDL